MIRTVLPIATVAAPNTGVALRGLWSVVRSVSHRMLCAVVVEIMPAQPGPPAAGRDAVSPVMNAVVARAAVILETTAVMVPIAAQKVLYVAASGVARQDIHAVALDAAGFRIDVLMVNLFRFPFFRALFLPEHPSIISSPVKPAII